MGRPKLEIQYKKIHRIGINATSDKLLILEEKAKMANITIAEYVFNIAIKGKVTPHFTDEEKGYYRALVSLANNTNQLARQANTFGFNVAKYELEKLHIEFIELIKTFKK